jgi:hypothetical protein
VLMYRCPITCHQVTTGIDTTEQALARLGALKISVSCPFCEGGHIIRANEPGVSITEAA